MQYTYSSYNTYNAHTPHIICISIYTKPRTCVRVERLSPVYLVVFVCLPVSISLYRRLRWRRKLLWILLLLPIWCLTIKRYTFIHAQHIHTPSHIYTLSLSHSHAHNIYSYTLTQTFQRLFNLMKHRSVDVALAAWDLMVLILGSVAQRSVSYGIVLYRIGRERERIST